jgi:hypothetical protein
MNDLLVWLGRIDRRIVFAASLCVAALVFLLPDPLGAILLLMVVAVLASLLRLTWTVTAPGMRSVRLLVLALLAVIALTRLR